MNTFFRKLISLTTETAGVNWDAVYADSLLRVFHYFCYRVSDTQNAEDLTAVTFEKAWRARLQVFFRARYTHLLADGNRPPCGNGLFSHPHDRSRTG